MCDLDNLTSRIFLPEKLTKQLWLFIHTLMPFVECDDDGSERFREKRDSRGREEKIKEDWTAVCDNRFLWFLQLLRVLMLVLLP